MVQNEITSNPLGLVLKDLVLAWVVDISPENVIDVLTTLAMVYMLTEV